MSEPARKRSHHGPPHLNEYLRKPEPTRRPKGNGSVRRYKYNGGGFEAVAPKWAGQRVIARVAFRFQAERALEQWLRDNPRALRSSCGALSRWLRRKPDGRQA